MQTPPPVLYDQKQRDADQLKLLAIFHYVLAGLSLLGIAFLLLHYTMFSKILNHPEIFESLAEGDGTLENRQGPSPAGFLEFFAMFKWFYLVMGIWMVIGAICNLLSGLWIRSRRNRTFSMVIAGINCIKMPLGTALGVFTMVVLMRDSVREAYEEQR